MACIFFGSEEWDGSLSLFDMMDVPDPEVLACMDNYHVRLIAPAQMEDLEIMKFQSSLCEAMIFIKYSKDWKNLNQIFKSNEKRFWELEYRAADVIEVITNSWLNYSESEETVDMSQAIQEMRMESERKGRLEGERKGRLMQAQKSARKLHEMGIDAEKIGQVVGYAIGTVNEWLGLSDDAR